ncbi:MAG: ParB N-terminal domain-containing protein, partial [Desulfocapsaceae bacterium]|nr:ParB N-terminal domain-containing protein [Desulfocapsaceae bacterium]
MKNESFQTIALKTLLDADGDRFSLHRDLDSTPSPELVNSVKRHGLLHPPIVMKTGDGYQVVCGRYRIQALLTIKSHQDVLCRVIEPVDKETFLSIILEDQRLCGPLSAIMTARFVKLVDRLVPESAGDDIIKQCNIGPCGQVRRLLPLLTLEESIRQAIHHGSVSDRTGLILCSMTPEDRIFFCDLFMALGLNKNKQRQLVDMCRVLTVHTGKSIKNLFHEDFSEFLPKNLPANTPQAAARLMRAVHEASHPLSSEAEKHFHEQKKGLGLPANCSLSHSPAFEKDQVTLSIDFINIAEMNRVW